MELTCGVAIATHNRREELARTCEVLAHLVPPADEVIICADGCTDGTADFVRQTYPNFRLVENAPGLGSVASRDRMMREASADIVISLDDDSHPIETDFVRRVVDLFESRPRLAIASFPQQTDEFPETLGRTDFGPNLHVGTYAASAAAFRRASYLQLEGWDTSFGHVYEEPDYGLQCIAAGFEVLHFTGVTVRHRYSATNRDEIRIHHRHARNEQWSVWRRCPMPWAPAVAAFRAARQLGYAATRGLPWLLREPQWWFSAFAGAGRCRTTRRPVPWPAYRRWLQLIRKPEPMK